MDETKIKRMCVELELETVNVDGGWNESRGSVWNDEGIAWIEVSECIYEDCNSEVRVIVRLIMFSM